MSYYDDYDDEYSSSDEIFYHNYSVDYANQILGGHHAVSSCLPRRRRKHRRYSPRLVRVSTLDQMPIVSRHQILPSLHSRPKYDDGGDTLYPPPPPPLPSLEVTGEELERRVRQGTQATPQNISNNMSPLAENNNNSSSRNPYRPLTEAELRQVQQQQEAFQQHLLNIQRHLIEQTQEQQQQTEQRQEQRAPSQPSSSSPFKKRTKVSYHDMERDDDQAQIAELIENDPYFAAAMEDFAHTHGLLHADRHRTHSNNSSSRHSSHLYEGRRTRFERESSRPSTPSSASSTSSLTNVTTDVKDSTNELILFRELHGIRRLMEEYVRARNTNNNPIQPNISILPVPWPMPGGQFPFPTTTPTGVHYPPVPPVTDYERATVPPQRVSPPDPNQVLYQNVVNTVKEVMERRSPSQHDQPLKPSEIDPKLKHVYTRRPRIPSSNIQPTSMQRPPLLPSLSQQQQRRRRSSQISTPPMSSAIPPSPSTNIPAAPPYEPLANFSSFRSTTNRNRNLSYGNRQKQLNIYDTLQPGRYVRFYTDQFN